MRQLTVFDAFARPVPLVPKWASSDLDVDLFTVVNAIPTVGYAKGSYRETIQRPMALLYFRPDLVAKADRARYFEICMRVTGVQVADEFGEDGMRVLGPAWVRLNGKPERQENARYAVRRFTSTDVPTPWMIDPIAAHGAASFWEWFSRSCARVGCTRRKRSKSKRSPVYARSLSQFILAANASAHVTAAVGLCLAGVEPFGDEWMVALDVALGTGQPWAPELMKVSMAGTSTPLGRAMAWYRYAMPSE